MRKFIYERAVIIAICLAFFAFGFSLAAHFYELTFGEAVTGLISGAVCGITILVVELANSVRPSLRQSASGNAPEVLSDR